MSQPRITRARLESNFARLHEKVSRNQSLAFQAIDTADGNATLELPTGSGKTAVGIAFLLSCKQVSSGPLFYVVPNKAQVQQVLEQYPGVELVAGYGRSEYDCLYYGEDEKLGRYPRADEIPCSMLTECPHRVNLDTGMTEDPEEEPCPYLSAKFKARKSGKIVVCTVAYYIYNYVMSADWQPPAGVVFDEVHDLANAVRQTLTYDITDTHIEWAIRLLDSAEAKREAAGLRKFLRFMRTVVRRSRPGDETLLKPSSIRALIGHLEKIKGEKLYEEVITRLSSGEINSVDERETLTALEMLLRGLGRYIRSLGFALATDERPALDYVFAFHSKSYDGDNQDGARQVRHKLVVRGYYVAALIRKRFMGDRTLAYSATIGNPEVFGFETGIRLPFTSFGSVFPPENTRVYLPSDAPDLSWQASRGRNGRKKGTHAKTLRRVVRTVAEFASRGIRSLVITASNRELEDVLELCRQEEVEAVSYGNGTPARAALTSFKSGRGSVLVGTTANFGQGIDLVGKVAEVTFFLRPGYPPPDTPERIFEEERFGDRLWRLINWRIAIRALQVRGRNVRTKDDKGVTFFVASKFRSVVPPVLPDWLAPSYRDRMTFDECVDDALKLLSE